MARKMETGDLFHLKERYEDILRCPSHRVVIRRVATELHVLSPVVAVSTASVSPRRGEDGCPGPEIQTILVTISPSYLQPLLKHGSLDIQLFRVACEILVNFTIFHIRFFVYTLPKLASQIMRSRRTHESGR